MSRGFRAEHDPWLSQVLERPTFRVAAQECVGGPEASDASWLHRPGFYYAKVATTDLARVHALTDLGFRVVDVSLVLDRSPGSVPDRPSAALVRPATPEDAEALLDIAGSCFVYSRFHLDPRFPRLVADRVKREWVRSYVEGRRGEILTVAELDGKPAGFLAALRAECHGRTARVIDLIGVAKSAQGCGFGKALVQDFITAAGPPVELLRVGTQAANVPSMRLYEQCGFRLSESVYVMHAHRDGEATPL